MKFVSLTQGDTKHIFRATLKWPDGQLVDLTLATTHFVAQNFDETKSYVGTATNVLLSNVEYQPLNTDMYEPGLYWERWRVTFPGGAIEHFPNGQEINVIEILRKLA